MPRRKPQTEAGKRLALLLEGNTRFTDLSAGRDCGQSSVAEVIGEDGEAIRYELELWPRPSSAVEHGISMPPDDIEPVNLWVIWLNGELASPHGYHHRGEAIDALAAADKDKPEPAKEGDWVKYWMPPYHPGGDEGDDIDFVWATIPRGDCDG